MIILTDLMIENRFSSLFIYKLIKWFFKSGMNTSDNSLALVTKSSSRMRRVSVCPVHSVL